MRDLAVIETDDAILVADRGRSDAVRDLVDAAASAAGRTEAEASAHAEEQRPWGSFRVLHEGPGFKVKEIVVAPGGRLSLQSHEHRAEHWVVVTGTAQRHRGRRRYRPPGAKSERARAPSRAASSWKIGARVAMRLIEVQCGDYLGEDDIVRYEDVYGRS